MGYRSPSLLSPAAALGGLTYTPAKVTGGAAAGASAGSLASTLTGTVSYSVLSGALVVNASTGALTTTGTAPSSGSIAARVIADNGINIVGLTIGVPVQAAAIPAAPPAPSAYTASGPSVSGSGAQPNATIQVFDGSTSLGTTTASSAGVWSLMLASPLGIGSHSLTATQTVSGATSTASSALVVSVTTLAPTGVKTDAAMSSPLAPITLPAFTQQALPAGARQITIDASQTFQTFTGVGAALTDSTCYLLTNSMTAAQRLAFLQDAFGTNGFLTSRICMGTSDFNALSSGAYYTYADNGGTADPNLTSFSITQDQAYIVPRLLDALSVNPNIKFIASPWTPPNWLTTETGFGSSDNNKYFNATAANLATYANYFVKFVQAYKALGIPIWAVTVQNEGNFAPSGYPGCRWNPWDYASFIVNYLAPAFQAANLTTLILPGDIAWGDNGAPGHTSTSTGDFVYDTLNGASSSIPPASPIAAAANVGGVAYHGYDGGPWRMPLDVAATPTLPVHLTEISTFQPSINAGALLSYTPAQALQFLAGTIAVGCLSYGCSSLTMWNLLLDPSGNPYNAAASQSKGIRGCASVTTDGAATVVKNPEYLVLSHLARYIKPGAVRIGCTTFSKSYATTDVGAVAFKNPDGSKALFLWNGSAASQSLLIKDAAAGGVATPITLAAGDVVSLAWTQAAASTAVPDAPTVRGVAYPTGVTVNLIQEVAPSANGSPITGYDVASATTSGGEAVIATNVSLPYQAPGAVGTTLFVQARARNVNGPGPWSAEVALPPSATGPAHYLNGDLNHNAYTPGLLSQDAFDGYYDLEAFLSPSTVSAQTCLLEKWANTQTWSNSSYNFQVNPSGYLTIYYYKSTAANSVATAQCSVLFNTFATAGVPVHVRALLNPTSRALAPRGVTVKTAGGVAITSIAPGTCVFAYSTDGVNYTQAGATVTGLTTAGCGVPAASTFAVVGTATTGTNNNLGTARFFRVSARRSTGDYGVYADFTQNAAAITAFNDNAEVSNPWAMQSGAQV